LHAYVPNEGDAWSYTLDELGAYYERALTLPPEDRDIGIPADHPLELLDTAIPERAEQLIGAYLGSARLLGRRTAELHLALASDPDDPAFAPEAFSALYQRSLYQSMRSLTGQVFGLLRRRTKDLPETVQVLDLEDDIVVRFRSLTDEVIEATRIRCHGDYHLGQVLWTGKDFVIIDFEGEPARPLSERRIKRSPLRDVAGMIRSYHYAAYTPVYGGRAHGHDPAVLMLWARLWYLCTSAAFLEEYLAATAGSFIVPQSRRQTRTLLDAYLLEKAVYEVGYEANNRPDWIKIPIQGILQLLEAD
jgi:maltose alpha-D-glucosyltransferase/alpha-amylase